MLTTSHIERLLTFYDLGKLQRVTQAYHGNVNETAFIQTSRGHFVVRRNQQRLNDATHRYRHNLINRLNERGFPAPMLIPTRDGATLLRLDGRLYEVQAYIDGKDYDPDRPQQLVSIGTTLAAYHAAVQGFALPPDQAQPRYSSRSIMALTERLIECDVMGDLSASLAWYDARAAQLRAALPSASYVRLPHCVIHGDMHSGNLRFVGDRVVALLDYDQVAWDARIVDLADALVSFATTRDSTNQLMWGTFSGPLDETRAARLITGYTSVSPLTPAEIAALPTLVELLWLQGELARVASTLEGSPDYHLDILHQGRWLSKWMREHGERMADHWAELNIATVKPASVPLVAMEPADLPLAA